MYSPNTDTHIYRHPEYEHNLGAWIKRRNKSASTNWIYIHCILPGIFFLTINYWNKILIYYE